MKVSFAWLNKEFFGGTLPSVERVEEALLLHAWEVEEVIEKDGDTMLDIKVLPDKAPWALSHRGIAKDLSVILDLPLVRDPLSDAPLLLPEAEALSVSLATPMCDRYCAAYLTGVTVGPSPEWLQRSLATIGQRSINNIVDATNYVMYAVGQPLHAFDARKLSGLSVGVRSARAGEEIVSLTGETYALSHDDTIIVDGVSDEPIGIAGVKGGRRAEVDATTRDLIIEAAHFDRVAIRRTSQRLGLRTDASVRFENGIAPEFTAYGLRDVVALIVQIAGGACEGYVDTGLVPSSPRRITLSVGQLNATLGVSLDRAVVDGILARFAYPASWKGDEVTVTPPFERTDLVIAEDLMEEIGRVYGYQHIPSIKPKATPLPEINAGFYYTDLVRSTLTECGFSEVYTSSFRSDDAIALKNALASDKGYLRSALKQNMEDVLRRNAPYADLLGAREVRAFEVGMVFVPDEAGIPSEYASLALGVRSPSGYHPKHDDPILEQGISAVEAALGCALSWSRSNGIAEADLSGAYGALSAPNAYRPFVPAASVTYVPVSPYPSASRDVAFWGADGMTVEKASALIRAHAGNLLQRMDLFDTFAKDGRTSYAFRLVFQSHERTLTETDISSSMDNVYRALESVGCEIR